MKGSEKNGRREEVCFGNSKWILGGLKLSVNENCLCIWGVFYLNMILRMWNLYRGPVGLVNTKKIIFSLCVGKKVMIYTSIFSWEISSIALFKLKYLWNGNI